MKTLFLVLSLACVLIVSSCKTVFTPYHSTSSLPQKSYAIKTEMKIINLDDTRRTASDAIGYNYGISACKDLYGTEVKYYLIICPLNGSGEYKPALNDCNLGYATTISVEKAQALIDGLEYSLRNWDVRLSAKEGKFFEFNISPEQNVVQKSENTAEWTPSFNYRWSNNTTGSSAGIIFGEGALKMAMKFNKESVTDLKSHLEEGLAELRRMGM
ncbi:MAG: hypothetical protein K1X91_08750 [Bacteriodetes bacterium]|nr:hypothetical protein [Bacteroidota bacterium]